MNRDHHPFRPDEVEHPSIGRTIQLTDFSLTGRLVQCDELRVVNGEPEVIVALSHEVEADRPDFRSVIRREDLPQLAEWAMQLYWRSA